MLISCLKDDINSYSIQCKEKENIKENIQNNLPNRSPKKAKPVKKLYKLI